MPTAGLATRGGLDRGRIPPTYYQTSNPRSLRSKLAGRTLLQVLQKVLVARQSIAVVACSGVGDNRHRARACRVREDAQRRVSRS